MLVQRPDPIVEDRVLGGEVHRAGIQPCGDVPWPHRNDSAVRPNSSDLGWRLISDVHERHQVRPSARGPSRPYAGNKHVLNRPPFELAHFVLNRFVHTKFASDDAIPVQVRVERVDDGDAAYG